MTYADLQYCIAGTYDASAISPCIDSGNNANWNFSTTWLSGYTNRKKVTLAGTTAGAMSNYQKNLRIYKTAGTDSDYTTFLGTKVLNNFYDVRFTTSDGITQLPYWRMVSTSGVSEEVWIKFNAISASPATNDFYIYYNNSVAGNRSNSTNTFIQYHGSTSSAYQDGFLHLFAKMQV